VWQLGLNTAVTLAAVWHVHTRRWREPLTKGETGGAGASKSIQTRGAARRAVEESDSDLASRLFSAACLLLLEPVCFLLAEVLTPLYDGSLEAINEFPYNALVFGVPVAAVVFFSAAMIYSIVLVTLLLYRPKKAP